MNTCELDLERESREIVFTAQDLFYNCKLKECITYVEEKDLFLDLQSHQTLQLYRGLSLFESQELEKALHCFDQIIGESKCLKEHKVDEIDVILRIQYQLQLKYYCYQLAEQNNQLLQQVLQDYKDQNESSPNYEQAVFLFGQGTYFFIETVREGLNPIAIKYLNEALRLSQKYKQEITLMIGNTFFYSGQIGKARDWYRELYNLNPRFPSAANNYAVCSKELNQQKLAEQLYLEDESLRSYSPLILSNIVHFYMSQKNKEKETEYLNKLQSLTPLNSFIMSKIGQFSLTEGNDTSEGVIKMKQAIEMEPKIVLPYDDLILSEFKHQNFEVASEYLKICIELYPHDGYFHFIQGKIHFIEEDFELAKLHLQKSITFKNSQTTKQKSHYWLGYVYEQQKDYMNAVTQYFLVNSYQTDTNQEWSKRVINKINQLKSDEVISFKTIIEAINNHSGIGVTRFLYFATRMEEFKALFLYRLETLRVIIMIQQYKKYIEEHLTFKSDTQFWDLYFD